MNLKQLISKKPVKLLLQALVYITVGYFIFSRIGSGVRFMARLQDVDTFLLILSILIYSTHTLLNSVLWGYMIRAAGERVGYAGQMEVYIDSFLLRYIPGNVTGILARGFYNRKYGISMVKSIWGWLFENVLYLIVGLIFSLYFLTVFSIDQDLQLFLIIAALLGGIFFIAKHEWFNKLFEGVLKKTVKRLDGRDGLELKLSFKDRFVLLGGYILAWFIYSFSFIVLLEAFHETNYDLAGAISANALAWSVGYLAIITPSGTGVREGLLVLFLSDFVGLAPESSVIIALLARVVSVLGELSAFGVIKVYNLTDKLISEKNGETVSE